VFSFLSYLVSFQRCPGFLCCAGWVLMTLWGVTVWRSGRGMESVSASGDAMKLKLGEHVVA